MKQTYWIIDFQEDGPSIFEVNWRAAKKYIRKGWAIRLHSHPF